MIQLAVCYTNDPHRLMVLPWRVCGEQFLCNLVNRCIVIDSMNGREKKQPSATDWNSGILHNWKLINFHLATECANSTAAHFGTNWRYGISIASLLCARLCAVVWMFVRPDCIEVEVLSLPAGHMCHEKHSIFFDSTRPFFCSSLHREIGL